MKKENVRFWVGAAARRSEYFGVDRANVNNEELTKQLIEKLDGGESINLKDLLNLTSKADIKLAAAIEAIGKNVNGLSIEKDEVDKIASNLVDQTEDELLDPTESKLLQEAIKIVTLGDSKLVSSDPKVVAAIGRIEIAVLKEVVSEQIDDKKLEGLFNAANDRAKKELKDVKGPDGKSIIENLPEKIVIGSDDFKKMKESFKEDMAKYMREPRTLEGGGAKTRVIATDVNQAMMAARALFKNDPYITGKVDTIKLSDFSGNMFAGSVESELTSAVAESPANFGERPDGTDTLGTGAEGGTKILESAEIKSDFKERVEDGVKKNAANMEKTLEKMDHLKDESVEVTADKEDDKKDAASTTP